MYRTEFEANANGFTSAPQRRVMVTRQADWSGVRRVMQAAALLVAVVVVRHVAGL